jgi:hypothetical protein
VTLPSTTRRFATVPALAALALLLVSATACQSEAERLQGETLYHLDQAVGILEHNAGNTDAAVAALDRYLVDNRDRIMEAKAKGILVMKRMSASEQESFRQRAMDRSRPLRERIDTLARTFSDPPRVLKKVQEFL